MKHAPKQTATDGRARRKNVIRVDASVGSAVREIERVFGLPDGSVRLVNPDGRTARADKAIGSLLRDYGW